jgi:hypothetical protein
MSLTNILLIVVIVLLVVNLVLLFLHLVATFTLPERLMEMFLDEAESVMDAAVNEVVEVEVMPPEPEEPAKPKKGFSQSQKTNRFSRPKPVKPRHWKKLNQEDAK